MSPITAHHNTLNYYTRIFPHCQAFYAIFTEKFLFCGFLTTQNPPCSQKKAIITKKSERQPCRSDYIHFLSVNSRMIRVFGFYYLNVVVNIHARTCGNKLTDNNIFLQAEKVVALALDCRIGKGAGCFLE